MSDNSLTDHLLRFLFPWRNVRTADQLAGEIARQCRAGLWQRIDRPTATMSIAEARGYVRAQAAAVVEEAADGLLCRDHLSPALRNRVRELAISQLIGVTLHDLLTVELPATVRTRAA